jgi:hypothetical protein
MVKINLKKQQLYPVPNFPENSEDEMTMPPFFETPRIGKLFKPQILTLFGLKMGQKRLKTF